MNLLVTNLLSAEYYANFLDSLAVNCVQQPGAIKNICVLNSKTQQTTKTTKCCLTFEPKKFNKFVINLSFK